VSDLPFYLLFYEKPGCVGNRQQKQLLHSHGFTLEVRDLLTHAWTADELRPFFTDKPVVQWFNQSAPMVKSGQLDIYKLNEQQALELMINDPLLICRPLLQYGDIKQSGFTTGPVLDHLNIMLEPDVDLQSCPMASDEPICEAPA
jgi:nitrogenase-associated protein